MSSVPWPSLRKDPDVDSLGAAHEPLERRAPEPARPRTRERVADEDLGDAQPPRMVEDGGRRITPREDIEASLLRPRQRGVALVGQAVLVGQVLLHDVGGE